MTDLDSMSFSLRLSEVLNREKKIEVSMIPTQ